MLMYHLYPRHSTSSWQLRLYIYQIFSPRMGFAQPRQYLAQGMYYGKSGRLTIYFLRANHAYQLSKRCFSSCSIIPSNCSGTRRRKQPGIVGAVFSRGAPSGGLLGPCCAWAHGRTRPKTEEYWYQVLKEQPFRPFVRIYSLSRG